VNDGRPERPAAERDEPPPFGGSWGALYALVIAALAACIAALAWLTERWR
jgi:hypothetical protein